MIMKVKLKSELKPQWHIHGLTQDKLYDVIQISNNYYRLVNDDNSPVLFDIRAFDIVDDEIPSNWVYKVWINEDDEIFHDPDVEEIIYQNFTEFYSLIPKCFTEPNNFFERYHDDDPECIQIFKNYLKNMNMET